MCGAHECDGYILVPCRRAEQECDVMELLYGGEGLRSGEWGKWVF